MGAIFIVIIYKYSQNDQSSKILLLPYLYYLLRLVHAPISPFIALNAFIFAITIRFVTALS